MDLGLVNFADLPAGLSPEQRMRNLLRKRDGDIAAEAQCLQNACSGPDSRPRSCRLGPREDGPEPSVDRRVPELEAVLERANW